METNQERLPRNLVELGRRTRADAAHRLAKIAMGRAATAVIARQGNGVQLAEHALVLLRRADALAALAAQDAAADQARAGALGKPGGDDAST